MCSFHYTARHNCLCLLCERSKAIGNPFSVLVRCYRDVPAQVVALVEQLKADPVSAMQR